jgi:VanZ family protein
MKLDYRTLHKARVLDSILFWPVLALVIWGELGSFGGAANIRINDKLLHFSAYFALGMMAASAFRTRPPARIAVLALIVLGGALEILQNYVGREMSAWDQLANTAGALTGGVMGRLIVEPLRRRFTESWGPP